MVHEVDLSCLVFKSADFHFVILSLYIIKEYDIFYLYVLLKFFIFGLSFLQFVPVLF